MQEINREIKGKVVGYIAGALGLVAGLAWNEAITALIDTLFPLSKDSLWIKFVYALLITLFVVIVLRYVERLFKDEDNKRV